jgi:DNA-binding LacI/PurR family transcriptional regulator
MVVMRGLRRARLQIPHDMSILGFDGLAMGELLSPPLASVCAPNREIGCAAWQRLLSRVTGTYEASGELSLTLTLPHSLREGATIAAISNRADNPPAHASA